VDIPVSCPSDSNGDGLMDEGGCSEQLAYWQDSNFMTLYELDSNAPDDLIQTMYFPPARVDLRCDVWGCAPSGSGWSEPLSYDSPPFPPKVSAEMAVVVNWGAFQDPGRACGVGQSWLNPVSAASLVGPGLAPDSIAAVFGEGLAAFTASATTMPLPGSLAGTALQITDRLGVRHSAPLFFVSPEQVNFQVPAAAALGAATVSVIRGETVRAVAPVQIESAAPGLFAANGDGKGVAAAAVVRMQADGAQIYTPVFDCWQRPGTCVPAPIDLGPETDQLVLMLFGTGIRNVSAQNAASVTIGDETPEVLYAGPQGDFLGLDQVHVALPRSLIGKGEVNVAVTVEGKSSNSVTIHIR